MDFISWIHLLDSMYKLNYKMVKHVALSIFWTIAEAMKKMVCQRGSTVLTGIEIQPIPSAICSAVKAHVQAEANRSKQTFLSTNFTSCLYFCLSNLPVNRLSIFYPWQRIHSETCKMWVLITHDRLCCNSSAEVIVALRVVE